jgi:hypothetical protein
MERDFETNSSHLCTSRTALWCPICGAAAGQGCSPVKGLRFAGHNLYALGQVRTVQFPGLSGEPINRTPFRPKPYFVAHNFSDFRA